MARGNVKNLITPTSEQARINGRKGGLASQKKQRERKMWKELAQAVGDMVVTDPNLLKKTKVTDLDVNQKDITYSMLVVYRQFIKAITRGDTKAAEFLRDTAGEKPLNQVEQVNDVEDLTPLAEMFQITEGEEDEQDSNN